MSLMKPRTRDVIVAAPTLAVDFSSCKAWPLLFYRYFPSICLTLKGKNRKMTGLILELSILEMYLG
jgi:hypothetical protein